MSEQCIHGFPTQQCVSCRTCPHGQVASACAKCQAPATTRKAVAAAAPMPPAEQYGDYEVFYAPEVSGWRYRGAESGASQLSYRSAFLARKAIDQIAVAPAKSGSRTKRRSKA